MKGLELLSGSKQVSQPDTLRGVRLLTCFTRKKSNGPAEEEDVAFVDRLFLLWQARRRALRGLPILIEIYTFGRGDA